jgi:hypothetical protein
MKKTKEKSEALTYKKLDMFPQADWRGRHCKDEVSGFEGVCTARYDYINGCIRVEMSGKDKDGKPEGFIFDQQQVLWADKWLDSFAPAEPEKYEVKKQPVGGPPIKRPIAR